MKQVLQDARSGRVSVEDVVAPTLWSGGLLVRTAASVVSAGTERSIGAFAAKSLLGKARERPDLVRQVWEKVRREGMASAYVAVRGRLDEPLQLGYSLSGTVIAVGPGADRLAVGERVACAGTGYAVHAEIASVPRNLCVPIPRRPDGSEVPFEQAAFATLGAVALQGVRLASPTLGERVVVVGLGVIGQLAVQLFRAHGCAVLGIDRDEARVAIARELGADGVVLREDSVLSKVASFTRGGGADAVLIAAGTESNEPIELAGEVSRRKGRVVVVGAVRMDVPRRTYYERELSVTVSCSYGPGRYDPAYEEAGIDYPIAYVRWTEQRNLEAFLDLLAEGRIDVSRLISHRFPVTEAGAAYARLQDPSEPSLGIVLTYPVSEAPQRARVVRAAGAGVADGRVGVGAIGAGAFARSVLFPALARERAVHLRAVAAATGVKALQCARRFGFERVATDPAEVLDDPDVRAVFVLTPHSLHAPLVTAALKAGRHVFVEKPLCVSETELLELASLYRALGADAPLLTVGFNRRFSPLARRVREGAAGAGPLLLAYRVNAGALHPGHWLQFPGEGGRIIGEACHFIDLAVFLTGALPVRVFATGPAHEAEPTTLVVDFADGSVLSLMYVQTGSRRLPKERLEMFGGGRTWVIDDWRQLTTFGGRRTQRLWRLSQAKGYREEIDAFVTAVRTGGPEPIAFEELAATTQATFSALESFRRKTPVDVPAV